MHGVPCSTCSGDGRLSVLDNSIGPGSAVQEYSSQVNRNCGPPGGGEWGGGPRSGPRQPGGDVAGCEAGKSGMTWTGDWGQGLDLLSWAEVEVSETGAGGLGPRDWMWDRNP